MAVRLKVSELTKKQQKQLSKELTFEYKTKNVLRSRYGSKKQPAPKTVECFYCEDGYVSVPAYWASQKLNIINEYATKKKKFKRTKEPRDDKQINELNLVIKKLIKYGSIALTLRTGAGKTAVSLFAACHFAGFTVVLVHNSDHCEQWFNSVKSYTTAKPNIVTLKKDKNGKPTKIPEDTDILICLYTRWNKIPLKTRQNVKLLIIDECDEFNNETGIKSVLAFTPLYIMGCTATFERPGTGLEVMMHAVLGYEMVSREFDVQFKVAKLLTGFVGELVPSEHTYGNDWHTLKKSLLYNMDRNRMIVTLVKIRLEEHVETHINEHCICKTSSNKNKNNARGTDTSSTCNKDNKDKNNTGNKDNTGNKCDKDKNNNECTCIDDCKICFKTKRKIMIICTEVDHVLLLGEMLRRRGIKCDTLYGKKKDYKDSDVLVTSAKRGGRGFDEENFCKKWGGKRINNVIIPDFVKNNADRTQWIGRCFRDEDPVIDQLVDNNQTTMRQWDHAEKMYTWMNAEIDEYELEGNADEDAELDKDIEIDKLRELAAVVEKERATRKKEKLREAKKMAKLTAKQKAKEMAQKIIAKQDKANKQINDEESVESSISEVNTSEESEVEDSDENIFEELISEVSDISEEY